MQENILGVDYFLLVSFLWLIAALDYQLAISCDAKGKTRKTRVKLLRIAFFVLWFMAAFRGLDITNDTDAYYELYCKIATWGPESVKRVEKGYIILNCLFSNFFSNNFWGFRALLLCTTAIGYSAVEQWIERHGKSYGLCLLAYYYLVDSVYMSAVRQMIAAAIVLWALMFWERDKRITRSILYVLLVILAVFFHQSAILCLFIPLFNKFKCTFNTILCVVLVSIIAASTNIVNLVVSKIGIGTSYLTTEIGNATNVIVLSLLYVSLLALRYLSQRVQSNHETQYVIWFKLNEDFYAFAILFALSFTIMSLRAPGMSRMVIYFQIVGLPYISNTISGISNGKSRLIVKFIFGVAIWGYSIVTLVYRPEWQHLWPYHFFWS